MSQDIDWYWHTWRIRTTSEHREIGETHTMETEHREIGETHAMNIRPTSKLPNIEITPWTSGLLPSLLLLMKYFIRLSLALNIEARVAME